MRTEKITVHLSGGLGNQLFQISTGLKLSEITNKPLAVNLNLYKNPIIKSRLNANYSKKRKFELSFFEFISSIPIDKSFTPINGKFEKLISKLNEKQRRAIGIATEDSFGKNEWNNPQKIRRIVGHFMSPLYFNNFNYYDAFKVPNEKLHQWSKEIIQRIEIDKLTILHVRLGDYLSQSNIVVPSEFYYLTGIDYTQALSNSFGRPLLFSDQPELIRELFPSVYKKVEVVFPPINICVAEQLYVMSQSKSFICSNSTFSWWASNLRNNVFKIVVAPKFFYSSGYNQQEVSNFWPPNVHFIG